ncbi:ABC transporter permease [Fulvivirgaceae bacterium LMO-SS25]
MNKVLLIIQREFLSRVQKKSFLIATILTPLIFPILMGGLIYLAINEQKSVKQDVVRVVDESGRFDFTETSRFYFVESEMTIDEAKEDLNNSDDFGILHLPEFDIYNPTGIAIYTKSNPSLTMISDLESSIKNQIEDMKLKESGVDPAVLEALKTSVSVRSINLSETGEEVESSAGLSFGVGYAGGFLIYLFIFIYGAQVMQGVIEEKSNKIVEIVVSTVKPFQLMLGKVLGIASVGLAQLLIWIILISVLSMAVFSFFGLTSPSDAMMDQVAGNVTQVSGDDFASNPKVVEIMEMVNNIPFAYIISVFLFYFVGGYLLYGALFAAVGSAVENPSEAQQFMFPITIPLIISIIGLFMFVLNEPNGQVTFWLSIIPFTSPITMVGRLGFGVPVWELVLSMVLLVIGFLGTIWFAGRIYRIGILMHGTKVNYKTLGKWLFMKN